MELSVRSKRLIIAACSPEFSAIMRHFQYITFPHINTHLDDLIKDPTLYGWGPWLIFLEDNATIVGDIGFKGKPDGAKSVEIGYGISENARNKGYATEALKALIKWTFRYNRAVTVTAQCRHDNYPSIRVLEKADMIPVRQEHQMIYWELKK